MYCIPEWYPYGRWAVFGDQSAARVINTPYGAGGPPFILPACLIRGRVRCPYPEAPFNRALSASHVALTHEKDARSYHETVTSILSISRVCVPLSRSSFPPGVYTSDTVLETLFIGSSGLGMILHTTCACWKLKIPLPLPSAIYVLFTGWRNTRIS